MPSIFRKPQVEEQEELTEAEKRMQMLDEAEQAIDAAFSTGKADRAEITRVAQENAQDAVKIVGEAMEADEQADEMNRLAVIAENMGDREKTKEVRKRARAARREAKKAHKEATKAAKTAYDAIKFSQPGKLGFLRVVQVIYIINIAMTLATLLLTSRDSIVYNSMTIFSWITIILQGVGFWFFINYFKRAKECVIITSAFCLVTYIVSWFLSGKTTSVEFFGIGVWNVFLILYFALSSRIDAVFVNDFSSFKPRTQTEIKRSGWPFVRNLIIYFIVFSVLGHWMEAGLCQFIRLGWVQGEYDPSNTMLWRDWLYPYPMEGAAVVVIALALYPLWQFLLKRFKPAIAYTLSFVANAITCGAIEFFMGLIVNSNYQLWDYRENFGNLMGQVCLQNMLAFGVAASIIAWIVYPLLERLIAQVPRDTMNIIFVVIAVIGGILWSLYLIDPPESLEVSQDAATEQTAEAGTSTEDSTELSDEDALKVGATLVSNLLKSDGELSQEDREVLAELEATIKQQASDATTGDEQSGDSSSGDEESQTDGEEDESVAEAA
ncbi:MAG: hypothetical protein Q4A01_02345 [Coriobacteriales bacterium]|nr:hypothetical protein [Coriobacteriales bacterium]